MNIYKTTFKLCYLKRAGEEHYIRNIGNRDKRKKIRDCLYLNRLSLEGWRTGNIDYLQRRVEGDKGRGRKFSFQSWFFSLYHVICYI